MDDWQPTTLAGVLRRTLVRHEDERGVLREAWRASWTMPLGVGQLAQANHTVSRAGTLRGVHFHLLQADLWVVLDGRAQVGLADIRALLAGNESAVPQTLSLILGAGDCLLIPVGVAHGLWALSDVSLLYLVTEEHDGTDEHGFAWNDPAAGLPWPGDSPTLSTRDRQAPDLAGAVRRARISR
jgi:dTDP-4-dehydrorhamnose 3,5-epimerase